MKYVSPAKVGKDTVLEPDATEQLPDDEPATHSNSLQDDPVNTWMAVSKVVHSVQVEAEYVRPLPTTLYQIPGATLFTPRDNDPQP